VGNTAGNLAAPPPSPAPSPSPLRCRRPGGNRSSFARTRRRMPFPSPSTPAALCPRYSRNHHECHRWSRWGCLVPACSTCPSRSSWGATLRCTPPTGAARCTFQVAAAIRFSQGISTWHRGQGATCRRSPRICLSSLLTCPRCPRCVKHARAHALPPARTRVHT